MQDSTLNMNEMMDKTNEIAPSIQENMIMNPQDMESSFLVGES